MTATAPHSDAPTQTDGAPRPRRRLRGRITSGHMLMVVAAITAAVFNYAFLESADQREQVTVLRNAAATGDVLTADAVTTAPVAASPDVLAALVGPDEIDRIAGSIARHDLPAGIPIRHDELQPAATVDGGRAMSIPVDASRAAGGAISPGDRVDVIATGAGQSTYLLTAAEVLDVSSESAGPQGIGQLGSFSLTVAVDADSALGLANAISEGTIDVVRSTGADPADVSGAVALPAEGDSESEGRHDR